MNASRGMAALLATTASAVVIFGAVAAPTRVDDVASPGLGSESDGRCAPGGSGCQPTAGLTRTPATSLATPGIALAPPGGTPHPCEPAGQHLVLSVPTLAARSPSGALLQSSASPNPSQPCGPDGTAGIIPTVPPKCTVNATKVSQVNSAKAGDTVCFDGNSLAGNLLHITSSGTKELPITVSGDGATVVKGIKVDSDNVIVQGFKVIGAAAPGVLLKGDNLTLQNTQIDHPVGGDYDGIRFFSNDIKVLHNYILNITNTNGAHADCMQTYATTTPASRNILISGNRCEKVDNQCLIAQGPHSLAGNGSGKGESSGLVFSNNYCDAHASQAVHIDDFQNVTMIDNDIQGRVQKAFNLVNGSTGAKIGCNVLGPQVRKEVIVDGSSEPGYQG